MKHYWIYVEDKTNKEKRPRRGRWSKAEEDKIVRLRESGKGWEYIGNRLPGRTATSCRQYFWKHLADKTDNEKRTRLASVYDRYGFKLLSTMVTR